MALVLKSPCLRKSQQPVLYELEGFGFRLVSPQERVGPGPRKPGYSLTVQHSAHSVPVSPWPGLYSWGGVLPHRMLGGLQPTR